ncbi:MAG: Thymidylate kinase [Candidatus Saccharibacteria bacterium]|nr:Thymidylate kinase [Candidatus Saccharibacteria bacterium]
MGVFIAIEGGDGSGKATQSTLLSEFVQNELHKDVLKVSFPQYGQPSAYYAGKYLDGAYGTVDEVPADLASLTYALDRFAAKDTITNQLAKDNSVVIADRYVASNLAHQGTKFNDETERHSYYDRMMQTEYETLSIPRPDINIVLILPTDLAQANVDKKDARSYTDKKRDIHEADPNHLEKAKANYEELCRLYPDEFTAVHCTNDSGEMRSIDDIQQEIRDLLKL